MIEIKNAHSLGVRVLVYKTNIESVDDEGLLNAIQKFPQILDWNVDLEDCDKVLRVVCIDLEPDILTSSITHAGYLCQELED